MKRFFRLYGQFIAIAIIALSVLGILLLQTVAINRQNQLTEQIAKAAKQRTKQIDEVNRNIDCVVKFFSQKDRTNKSIEEIKECRIVAESGQTFTYSTESEEVQNPYTAISLPESSNQSPGQPATPQTPASQNNTSAPVNTGIPVISPIIDAVFKALGGS